MEIKDQEYKNIIETQINEVISGLNFKDPNSIDFNAVKEQIREICGGFIPSVMPKWTKYETANEDLKLDGSNKITEKITELTITYLVSNGVDSENRPIMVPVPLKYMI